MARFCCSSASLQKLAVVSKVSSTGKTMFLETIAGLKTASSAPPALKHRCRYTKCWAAVFVRSSHLELSRRDWKDRVDEGLHVDTMTSEKPARRRNYDEALKAQRLAK